MTPPTQDDLAAGRELDARVAKAMGLTGTKRVLLVESPDYSTSIDAAWRVLAGWSVTLAHAEGLPWHCHLMRCTREGVWLNGEGHGDTAPLAICRAALKAVSAQP